MKQLLRLVNIILRQMNTAAEMTRTIHVRSEVGHMSNVNEVQLHQYFQSDFKNI